MAKMIQGNNPQINGDYDIVGFLTVWEKEKENPFLFYLIYEEEEKIVGYLLYTQIYERMEIEQFFVHRDFQNKGIGTVLLEHLIQIAKQNQIENITLEVREDNQNAIHLYQKMGFQKVAKRDHYYQGMNGILMEKKLVFNKC